MPKDFLNGSLLNSDMPKLFNRNCWALSIEGEGGHCHIIGAVSTAVRPQSRFLFKNSLDHLNMANVFP